MVEDERSHNHKNYQCETSNSFLFSLTSRFNPILSRVNFEKEAIIWSKNEGPYFGLQDLYIKSSGSFINNIVETIKAALSDDFTEGVTKTWRQYNGTCKL
ncbi:11873_t:CDS:2 [Rhizophagus irregularis]|nr:11873_t:CDS:2 [Rhizophagus irregularis]